MVRVRSSRVVRVAVVRAPCWQALGAVPQTMAFPWHSPLVSQAGTPSQVPSKAPPPPPPEVHYDPAQQRAIRGAHAAACEAIECFAVPDASGKANNPATIIRAVEAAGMRLGPQGAGTLLAFADAGRSQC